MTIRKLYEELKGYIACGFGNNEIKVLLTTTGDEINILSLSENEDSTILFIDIE